MCHWIETFPLIFAFKGIYNLMITIPLPLKSMLVIEQCHKGVTVGQGEDSSVQDVVSMSETCHGGDPCVVVGLPNGGDSRPFALGKTFIDKAR